MSIVPWIKHEQHFSMLGLAASGKCWFNVGHGSELVIAFCVRVELESGVLPCQPQRLETPRPVSLDTATSHSES